MTDSADQLRDRQETIAAFEMVRKHGFIEAERLAKQWRDMNHPGTMSFALHNATVRKLREFASVSAIYRPIGS